MTLDQPMIGSAAAGLRELDHAALSVVPDMDP